MVPRLRLLGDFLRAVFSASRAQHVSDLHTKFTLMSHHVWKYGRHPISDRSDYRRGNKKEETTGRKYIWSALLHRATINNHPEMLFIHQIFNHFHEIDVGENEQISVEIQPFLTGVSFG